jgi:3'-phosphoadenosine 5'-phosphosulfate sulfotransferase (PAPS reductase)/FAD synthetase
MTPFEDFSTPLEDFDADDIWETKEGKLIPIPYMSDQHLQNAIPFLENARRRIACDYAATAENDYSYEWDTVQINDTIERMRSEIRRRWKQGTTVVEYNNPYYQARSTN